MHAVGGRVVAAVPLAVPDREALLAEQVGAEGVRGEVDRARLPDQVRRREQGRDDDRRGLPRVDAAVPRRAGGCRRGNRGDRGADFLRRRCLERRPAPRRRTARRAARRGQASREPAEPGEGLVTGHWSGARWTGACCTTFTTLVTRTILTGRSAKRRARARRRLVEARSRAGRPGTRIALEARALSRLIRRRGEPEWSLDRAAPTRLETRLHRGRSPRGRARTGSARRGAPRTGSSRSTPRANHDVTVSTRSKRTGHQSSTTPVDRPPAMDFERNSRTDL